MLFRALLATTQIRMRKVDGGAHLSQSITMVNSVSPRESLSRR